MDTTTQQLYPRRRATARQWLALIGSAAAVVLVLVLIVVACQGRGGGLPTAGQSPEGDVAVDADASGVAGDAGAAGDPEDPAEPPADGDNDGVDPGGEDPGGDDPDGPHDTWQPLSGFEVVLERHPVDASDYLRKGVHCPAGKVVLNGGFQSVGPATWGDPFILQESNPGTVGGGSVSLWLVSVANTSVIARFVDLYAVCADPPPGYQVTGHNVEVGAPGAAEENPSCEPASAVLGGGAQVVGAGSANFHTRILTTRPAGTGWRTFVTNDGAPRTLGFRVVCSVLPAGYDVVHQDLTLAPAHAGTAAASCPAGTAVGGGAEATDSYTGHVLRQSFPDGSSWVATVDSISPVLGERLFRVWAVCAQTS